MDHLKQPFRLIVFDWDGTAVESRAEDPGELRDQVEELLRQGVLIVIVTGTNFRNVDRQLSGAIRGPHKQHLFIATNRGSEVYGFDALSDPVLVSQRHASPDEDRLLTEVAERVRHAVVAATHLDVSIVYDRLNRRKIDLIPLPEWKDPPKASIGDLLAAVESRLKDAGLPGGLKDVFGLAELAAREAGLREARITSDVKHVEVGLTDKADAIKWALTSLAGPQGIKREEVLIAGDEFGPIAGFPGSDERMLVPDAVGATAVSVGLEPNGVPAGVIHLGGGPVRFRALLRDQILAHRASP